ncbi:MAG: electron transfer flavoprotein subunit beta/FixA family protein [Nitrospirae bacterium]|nr:electron transfer flavoprotein subunit beta/FixA family protein [Nitrospirota bacterium]MBF0536247.1 electron transfer flavoprotein subunit beta/FixA family protein [Nitrospirota bacterium]MBF0615819.1 electron transfer flavoprotein subunit beta/FixA family protein [Nitrospirota bacterium]
MKIVVCIKQVPDTAEVKINPQTNTLMRDGVPSIINPYDLHAIEAAVAIKEVMDATVTVLTMGPPQAEVALRESIAMGADEAVLLSDRAFAGSDTWATAYTLSGALKKLGFDLIFCGKQAIDGDTAQVGPAMAEFLDIPHVAYVSKINSISDTSVEVRRMMDDGYDVVETSVPVLFTVVRELNQPRFASLKGKMRAKNAQIKKLTHADIGLDEKDLGLSGSPTQVKNIFAPEMKKERVVFEGKPEEQVTELHNVLKSVKCI